MLVPFAIDAESLEPDAAWTMAQQIACHKAILETWSRIGILVHDGGEFNASLVKQAIDALPQKLRPLWYELLERLPIFPANPSWEGIVNNEQGCLDPLSSSAKVALLDDTKAEVEFELSDTELFHFLASHPSLEICRLLATAQSQTFTQALNFSAQHIPAGQTYSDLWHARFELLAKAPIKQITILDRFAVSQHYECPQDKLSGLERFCRLLDSDASSKKYVTLYSAWTHELNQNDVELSDVASIMQEVMGHLSQNLLKRIKIVMLPNNIFGSLHHDRFIRFGEYVWDIGIGVKVFEGAFAPETSTASFKAGLQIDTYLKAEDSLSAHARAKTIEVKG